MKLWIINCKEDWFPGMWQRWYKNQCVAVGWPPPPPKDPAWSRARNALNAMQTGDAVIVALRGNRIGRIGYITGKAVEDADWNPLVPKSRDLPRGEVGRRIFVRWDMTIGPDYRDRVVLLPEETRFSPGQLRPTICEVPIQRLQPVKDAMNDPNNWVGLITHFNVEAALQGYIAANPHRLEDGLLPYPDEKIREKVFGDRSRLDLLLIDRDEHPVVVECKRDAPWPSDLSQLRHYMERLSNETGSKPRGILVHGGALKLSQAIRKEAAKEPRVEVVRYALDVTFGLCA
jgi:Endonuclease NucS C-terminal domain